MSTIYIETTIVGYLTARSANDVIFLARQELTRRWWDRQRIVTSPLKNRTEPADARERENVPRNG